MRWFLFFFSIILMDVYSPSSSYDKGGKRDARSKLEQRDQAQDLFLGRNIKGGIPEVSDKIEVDSGSFYIDGHDVFGESESMNYKGSLRKHRLFFFWIPFQLCLDTFREDALAKCRKNDYKYLTLFEFNVVNFKMNVLYKNKTVFSSWFNAGYRLAGPRKDFLGFDVMYKEGGNAEGLTGTFVRFLLGFGRVINRGQFQYFKGKQTGDILLVIGYLGYEFNVFSSDNHFAASSGNDAVSNPHQLLLRVSFTVIKESGKSSSVMLGINPIPMVYRDGMLNTVKEFWAHLFFFSVTYTYELCLPNFKDIVS